MLSHGDKRRTLVPKNKRRDEVHVRGKPNPDMNDMTSLVTYIHKTIKSDPKEANYFLSKRLSEGVRSKAVSALLDDDTALSLAISVHAPSDLLNYILAGCGADVEQVCRGVVVQDGVAHSTNFSPLLKAVSCRNVTAVELLLEHGANVDGCTEDGYTALHGAAAVGDLEMAQVLVDSGASLNLKTHIGTTALMNAKNSSEVRTYLLSQGADCNIVNTYGRTALHQAALEGCTGSVRLLLDHGVEPRIQDIHGNTALHIAVYNGHAEIVQLLLDKNVNPYRRNFKKEDCFLMAASNSQSNILNLLIENHQTFTTQDPQ